MFSKTKLIDPPPIDKVLAIGYRAPSYDALKICEMFRKEFAWIFSVPETIVQDTRALDD